MSSNGKSVTGAASRFQPAAQPAPMANVGSSRSCATNGASSCLSAPPKAPDCGCAGRAVSDFRARILDFHSRPDGTELACVEDPPRCRPSLANCLRKNSARREFVPIIHRIVRVSGNSEPCEWQVETDRGPTRFVLKSEDDVRRIGDHEILIVDAHGTRYHIPDLNAVDVKSRRIVEWYV